ncbi:MAG TPA: hypothetical protein VLX56_04990 [Nitrososphaerales archaeon]|nr:hypothetical protein [Nitrososphaerales archaeon]
MLSVEVRLLLLFLVSVISNATAFFGAAYTFIATAELTATGVNLDNFVLVVFVTAAGATVGKIVIYLSAVSFQESLKRNRNVKLMGTWLGRAGFFVGLFVAALIPALPLDDYVYIGAGANGAKLAPMLGVTFLAKLLKSAFEILLELSGILEVSRLTRHLLGLSNLELSIIGSAAFVVLGIVIYKVNWGPIASRVARLVGRRPAAGPAIG